MGFVVVVSDTFFFFPRLCFLRYDAAYGARPLKRAIQREVETVLAKRIISGEVTEGETLVADVINERLVIAAKGMAAESSPSRAATGMDR